MRINRCTFVQEASVKCFGRAIINAYKPNYKLGDAVCWFCLTNRKCWRLLSKWTRSLIPHITKLIWLTFSTTYTRGWAFSLVLHARLLQRDHAQYDCLLKRSTLPRLRSVEHTLHTSSRSPLLRQGKINDNHRVQSSYTHWVHSFPCRTGPDN